MSYIYNFTRAIKADGTYDIDNIERVDGDGRQITLFSEIMEAFPDWLVMISCDGIECTIQSDTECSDIPALNIIVSNHKANL